MSEYIITDDQLQKDHEQFYEAGQRNRQVWTARVYHGQEIVRCKDCVKFSEQEPNGEIGTCELGLEDTGLVSIVEPDGFCAWGEKASNFTTCKCGEDIELGNRESAVCPSCGRAVIE